LRRLGGRREGGGRGDGGVDGQGGGLRRRAPGVRRRDPAARRHRHDLGARSAALPEARQSIGDRPRRCHLAPRTHRPPLGGVVADGATTLRLLPPSLRWLAQYEAALAVGWSPDTTRDVSAEQLAAARRDPYAFLAELTRQDGTI